MTLQSGLEALVKEVEEYVAAGGWDQPTRLFALVPTATLIAADPTVATELNLNADVPLTSVEQELEFGTDLEDLLGTIAWPEDVQGAMVVLERMMLPPSATDALPSEDDPEFMDVAANHPDRRDVRIVSAVLRTGGNLNALRYRDHDEASEVAIAPDLVTRLNDALLATFAD